MEKLKLSIIIPVYNEEKTLENIINKVQQVHLKKVSKELIIVNDGSKDKTEKIIAKLKNRYRNIRSFKHPYNRGKGAALRTGFKHASGNIITIQDGDLEYDPNEFKKMIKLILEGRTEVVYGSRLLRKTKGFWISSHYYGNKLLSFITKLLYLRKISDMETCYKMMSYEVLNELNLCSNGFNIEPEITAKIIRKGRDILEVPIKYTGRSFKEGKKINWRHGLQAIWTLFYWKFKEF